MKKSAKKSIAVEKMRNLLQKMGLKKTLKSKPKVVKPKPKVSEKKEKKKARKTDKKKVLRRNVCIEMGEDHYNKIYEKSTKYKKNVSDMEGSNYYKLWNMSVNTCINKNFTKIIDIGCGPGHFASLLQQKFPLLEMYKGYDFSTVALDMARKFVGEDKRFEFVKADATKVNYQENKDVIFTSFEFLEHINEDLKVIENIPSGSTFMFSVPNFWTAGHVRVFPNEDSIIKRYSHLLTNMNVLRLPVPQFPKSIHFYCSSTRL